MTLNRSIDTYIEIFKLYPESNNRQKVIKCLSIASKESISEKTRDAFLSKLDLFVFGTKEGKGLFANMKLACLSEYFDKLLSLEKN